MKDLLELHGAWRQDGIDIGRAVVIRTFGSAPRPEGSVLLASSDGRIAGSVSGGCVEGAAVEQIDAARRNGRSRVIRYGISDEAAWDVGLMCGGTIDVLVEPAVPVAVIDAASRSVAGAAHGSSVVTPLPPNAPPAEPGPQPPGTGAAPAAPLTVSEDGTLTGSSGDPATDAMLVAEAQAALRTGRSATVEHHGRSFFIEAFPVRPRIVIVGAVEVARSLAEIARQVGWSTVVVDPRPAFAVVERFPGVDVLQSWPDEAFEVLGIGPNDAIAVLSHDPKIDEPAIAEAFRRGSRYVGAIGSRKSQADRRRRLGEAGVPAPDLERLRGPIGLDLGGRAAAEIALAIMAEVIALRNGAGGGSSRDRAPGVQVVGEPAPISGG